MARVEHVAIWTRDLQRLRAFYERHLGGRAGAKYINAAGRLRTAGVAIADGPRQTGDGHHETVVLDPDGNRVEITV